MHPVIAESIRMKAPLEEEFLPFWERAEKCFFDGQPGLQRIEGERMEQELKRKTMVIGHRNPDTDSICSAICYANLKRALTGDEYVPARAGHVNGETQFVLNYFGLEEPKLVEDVRTQVKDIEIRKTKGVADNISLKRHGRSCRRIML